MAANGRLGGSRTVAADDGEIKADAILIATGAMPRVLPGAEPDGDRIFTWRQLYDLTEIPRDLIVVGSGVTGAEFPAPTRPSARGSPWSPPATGCCRMRTKTRPA